MIERFAQLPSALREKARWERLGPNDIPALIVHPDWQSSNTPLVLWMHGRTVNKELDPGRYLRLMRAGIGVCAVDLPGHGERLDPELQSPMRSLDVVVQMIGEIDQIVESIRDMKLFDDQRLGIGGMSAGGMAALARLCEPHPFTCCSVEATTGSWRHQTQRDMFREHSGQEWHNLDPIRRLDGWREIPLQVIHATRDEWVPIAGQEEFVTVLRARYRNPSLIEFIQFDQTGAPHEHLGFGKYASEEKDQQRDFFRRWLVEQAGATPSVRAPGAAV